MGVRGFSLIELIVVMALIGILVSVATLDFNSWQRKSTVEAQVKELYADIQDARMKAAYTKSTYRVEITSPQLVTFRRYSSGADVAGTVVKTKKLPVAVTTNMTPPIPTSIDFNTSGIMSDPDQKVICVTTTVDASYDAIIISGALTGMGKQTNRGADCAKTHVIQK